MSNRLDKKIKAAEAYFDYLKTGKLLPLADLASKNKFAKKLMLSAIANLDSGNSYPWAIKKLPGKLKSKKESGRPKLNEANNDFILTFIKLVTAREAMVAKIEGLRPPSKKQLIQTIGDEDKPSLMKFKELSLSQKYALLEKSEKHHSKDEKMLADLESIILDQDRVLQSFQKTPKRSHFFWKWFSAK